MKVATVEILIEKAHFEPQVAVAIAAAIDEAMEGKIQDLQLVTVPLLDFRLADLKSALTEEMHTLKVDLSGEMHAMKGDLRAEVHSMKGDLRGEVHAMKGGLRGEMHAMKGELLRHMYTAMLGQLALLLGVAYFFVLHVKQ